MKPVVSALNAWSCTVISAFAIIILSVIGSLFAANHHSMLGFEDDPPESNHAAIATSIFSAVVVYALFFIFCGSQAYLHLRASRRGAIAL